EIDSIAHSLARIDPARAGQSENVSGRSGRTKQPACFAAGVVAIDNRIVDRLRCHRLPLRSSAGRIIEVDRWEVTEEGKRVVLSQLGEVGRVVNDLRVENLLINRVQAA